MQKMQKCVACREHVLIKLTNQHQKPNWCNLPHTSVYLSWVYEDFQGLQFLNSLDRQLQRIVAEMLHTSAVFGPPSVNSAKALKKSLSYIHTALGSAMWSSA